MQGLHCTHFQKHQYPSTPHPLFPTYPRTVRRPRASADLLFNTEQMNRVNSSKEAPRSFTMAPCVVVERLEGKQRCTEPQYASTQESKPENDQGDCSRRNERSMKKRQTLHQPIMQSRQRGAQTTSAHLHWCGAHPSSSWPVQTASHEGHDPKRGYIFAIFAGVFETVRESPTNLVPGVPRRTQ